MSELNTPRLMAAAKEFNIGTQTLIDFLVSRNFSAADLKPSSKLSEEMYRVLQAEFQQDKAARQKAEQLDLPKSGGDAKKKKDEEDLSIRKKEEKAKAKTETPEPEKPIVPEKPAEPVAVVKIEAPELEGPKVLSKIDLDQVDSSTRPKKTAAKKKTDTDEPAAPVSPAPAPKAPEPPAPPAPPVIENIQADKLTGPKILGKIELPVDDSRARADEKQKRKRIPIQKKPGESPIRGMSAIPDSRGGRSSTTGGRPQRGADRKDRVIDEKEIQEKLKQTQAILSGSGGRGKSLKAKYRRTTACSSPSSSPSANSPTSWTSASPKSSANA